MNAGSAETPAFVSQPPAAGWSWNKIVLLILLAFAAHVAFVFLLGTRKTAAPRGVTNVPVFHFADGASDLVRLTDPTLFALPHAKDFPPAIWSQPPADSEPPFRWTEPPSFLTLNPANLGARFNAFMQTNRFAISQLNFKPAPQVILPPVAIESLLPQSSTWQLAGEIVGRRTLNTISPPTLAWNDVLPPSRVQLLVDQNGKVVSAVLLESSGDDAADQQALALARTLQFVPADQLMLGEIIFNWHTVPASTP
jgi:TonB family protein